MTQRKGAVEADCEMKFGLSGGDEKLINGDGSFDGQK